MSDKPDFNKDLERAISELVAKYPGCAILAKGVEKYGSGCSTIVVGKEYALAWLAHDFFSDKDTQEIFVLAALVGKAMQEEEINKARKN